jgi:hypothetical protein
MALKCPIISDRAKIGLKLQLEAYGGPVNDLQPRIEAVSGFRSYNLAFNGIEGTEYFLEVVAT